MSFGLQARTLTPCASALDGYSEMCISLGKSQHPSRQSFRCESGNLGKDNPRDQLCNICASVHYAKEEGLSATAAGDIIISSGCALLEPAVQKGFIFCVACANVCLTTRSLLRSHPDTNASETVHAFLGGLRCLKSHHGLWEPSPAPYIIHG